VKRLFLKDKVEKALLSQEWKPFPDFGESRLNGEFLKSGDRSFAYYESWKPALFIFKDLEEARKFHIALAGPLAIQSALEIEAGLRAGSLRTTFDRFFDRIVDISNISDARDFLSEVKGADISILRALRFLLICCLVANSNDPARIGLWHWATGDHGELNWLVFEKEGQFLNIGLDVALDFRGGHFSLRSGLLDAQMRSSGTWLTRDKLEWIIGLTPCKPSAV
jgi:hypothetical protein